MLEPGRTAPWWARTPSALCWCPSGLRPLRAAVWARGAAFMTAGWRITPAVPPPCAGRRCCCPKSPAPPTTGGGAGAHRARPVPGGRAEERGPKAPLLAGRYVNGSAAAVVAPAVVVAAAVAAAATAAPAAAAAAAKDDDNQDDPQAAAAGCRPPQPLLPQHILDSPHLFYLAHTMWGAAKWFPAGHLFFR